jgi:hypothetical protein
MVIGWFLTWWEVRNGAGFVILNDKKMRRGGCTRSKADGGINVVKCDGLREEGVRGSILLSCGFHALARS